MKSNETSMCSESDSMVATADKITSKKESTLCEKIEHSKKEGVPCRNVSSSTDIDTDIDLMSDRLNVVEISDDELFKDPPPKEDCPICLQPVSYAVCECGVITTYQPCCGKTLCTGCVLAANDEMNKGKMKRLCPLCRVPIHNGDKEYIKRVKKRMQMNDPEAFRILGSAYNTGSQGLKQNSKKAFELGNSAAKLGSICAHFNIAHAYKRGDGVEKDLDKAIQHYKLAAMGGNERARYDLGVSEGCNWNLNIAMKHFIISAKAGHDESLTAVGAGYKDGLITKEEYVNTLRAYKCSRDEMKSVQRDRAATIHS